MLGDKCGFKVTTFAVKILEQLSVKGDELIEQLMVHSVGRGIVGRIMVKGRLLHAIFLLLKVAVPLQMHIYTLALNSKRFQERGLPLQNGE